MRGKPTAATRVGNPCHELAPGSRHFINRIINLPLHVASIRRFQVHFDGHLPDGFERAGFEGHGFAAVGYFDRFYGHFIVPLGVRIARLEFRRAVGDGPVIGPLLDAAKAARMFASRLHAGSSGAGSHG